MSTVIMPPAPPKRTTETTEPDSISIWMRALKSMAEKIVLFAESEPLARKTAAAHLRALADKLDPPDVR